MGNTRFKSQVEGFFFVSSRSYVGPHAKNLGIAGLGYNRLHPSALSILLRFEKYIECFFL